MSEEKKIETPQVNVRRGFTSASNAAADRACPGRHTMQRGLPETDSPDAAFGRAIHEALKNQDPALLTATQQREIFDAIVNIEALKVAEFFGPDAEEARKRVFREERYWCRFSFEDKTFEHSGQADVVYRHGTRALVIEYKTLAGDVPESPENLQLRDQAVLVRGHFVVVEEIGAVVIQPLVTHKPVTCLYNKDALEQATVEMYQRVVMSNNPAAPRAAGDLQCRHCLAKLQCPEYNRWAAGMVPAMLGVLDVAVDAWTPEQRATFCNHLATAQRWLDETKEAMKNLLMTDPSAVPGWGLDQGRRKESIKDPQGCFERCAELGVTVEEFLSTVTVGKTRLKQVLMQATTKSGKALDAILAAILKDIVEVSQTAPSLKRLDDK